jgi:hypothetical protein
MSSIEYTSNPIKLKTLVTNLTIQSLVIPSHQRDFVWKRSAQQSLIDTVVRGIPIPAITIRKKTLSTGVEQSTLEDGQQRLTTLRLYMEGKFADKNGIYFSQLSEISKERFRSYMIPVTTYENATDEEAIEIFMKLQMGSVLSVGERLHAVKDKAPLVQYAQELLLTPGAGFYDRTIPFWGDSRTPKSARGKHTTRATVICAALAKKSSEFLSQEGINPEEIAKITEFDKESIKNSIEYIVNIFERVYENQPTKSAVIKNQYWEISNYIAYIIHGMLLTESDVTDFELPSLEQQSDVWVDFIVRQRMSPDILKEELLGDDKTKGGHYTKERWHRGWIRLFSGYVVEDSSPVNEFVSLDKED